MKNGSLSMEEELQQMRRAEVRAATMVNGTSERWVFIIFKLARQKIILIAGDVLLEAVT